MLNNKMTLKEMVDFLPSDIDMSELSLDDVVYIRTSVISLNKDDNYNFIKHLFTNSEVDDYINNKKSIVFYDFDGTKTNQEKFITIFEFTSPRIYNDLSIYLEEVLNAYSHEADVLIDMFTHDTKKYRLSNLEGIVKLEKF